MAQIFVWPGNHARASAGCAAKDIKSSAVTPAAAAFSVSTIEDHHSGGIQSRCHHFATMPAVAAPPISDAMAMREPEASLGPHSSTTDRNDLISDIAASLGRIVLKRKPLPSLDCELPLGHTVRMADSETEAQYKQGFTHRVKTARAGLGWKQWQMAEALDLPQDRYKQYEGRTLMPHHLIGRFCLITHVDPAWLMTGRGEKPLKALQLAASEPAPSAKPKPRRARRAA